ncbi:cytochrome P450 [Alicyclobacillus suci]|uniref:cytochrome P450 n=1 Tax=Alicyclobacillus suci TaxID=2816080 RepID=UPI001A907FC5|nr:cytochrome P450 [Alicyclobacillus suci]
MPIQEGILSGNPLRRYRQFRRNPIAFLENTKTFGDVVKIPSVNRQPTYIIHHPNVIRSILALDEPKIIKGSSAKVLGLTLGEGLLTSERSKHYRQRRQLQPAFHASMVERACADIIQLTAKHIANWDVRGTFCVSDALLDLTLDIVFEGLFGAEVGKDRALLHEIIECSVEYSANRLMQAIPMPYWMPTPSNQRHRRAVEQLDGILYRLLDNMKDTPERPTLLSHLLHMQDETGQPLPMEEIRDELATFVIGGHETTANLLSWVLYLLSEHPSVTENVRKEVDNVLGPRIPTSADVHHLPYVRQVIRETLRLYPPAWTMLRETTDQLTVENIEIPAGSSLIISPYVVHRDERWFQRADEFIPERFDEANAHQWPRFAYIPFGGGSRTCIGNTFAMAEATLVLAAIVKRYTWHHDKTRFVQPEPSVSLRVDGGLWATFDERAPFYQAL